MNLLTFAFISLIIYLVVDIQKGKLRSMHAAFMYLVTWVFSFLDFQLIDTANTYVTYGFVYLVLWNVYRRNI